jgi:hypothetical protein
MGWSNAPTRQLANVQRATQPLKRPPPTSATPARTVALERIDQFGDIRQVLATFVFGKGQGLPVKGPRAHGVTKNALRGVAVSETAIELSLWKEEHVGAKIALAEAGVADQLGRRFTLEQLHQALAESHSSAFATVRTATHHHVTRRHRLGHL